MDLTGQHITDHHQGGVVGHVPGFVPGAQLLDRHTFEVSHPADGWGVVAAGGEGQGLEALVGLGRGVVLGAQAAFFLDHLDLALKFFRRQTQAGQAVGLQLEGDAQAVAGQHLVIGGVVVAGEGVFFRAQFAQHP